MKKTVILLITLFCASAFAQDLPRIAVYVTGGVSENDKKALGTRMLASLVNSGRYRGIERTDAFLAKLDEEHVKQRSGAIDDSQISELGRQFGVEFICIADITPALGGFLVSARIINIETAEVVHIGETSSPFKSQKDLAEASDKIVRIMFNLPDPKRRMSVGVGEFFTNDFGGGIIWADARQEIAMPVMGGGMYLFFDAVYAEISFGISMMGGKWESNNVSDPNRLYETSRISLNMGAYGKYPIERGSITAFPQAGIDYELPVSAKFTRHNGTEVSLDGKDGRPESASDLGALWFKAGGGLDYMLNKNIYIRGSVLYGMRLANKFENDNINIDKNQNAESKTGHGITIRIGAGVRF